MDGQGFSREIAFSQSVINIGSDNGNDIVLRGSDIADFHALMHYDSGRWFISPLDRNLRIAINGRMVGADDTVVQNGSIVEIGSYRLTMMLNGINTDIIIQSPETADDSAADTYSVGASGNILLDITKMDRTELEAGTAVEIELTVTNAGPLVANMQLQLQGIPTAWVQVIPPVINLNEGRKGTFLVRVSPPRNSTAQAGLYNLHFVAISPNYPRNTGVADTALTILPYNEFLISGPTPMQLHLSRGKPADVAHMVVMNNANAAGNYFIQSRDDANELNFAYQKSGSGVAAGQEMLTVKAGDSVQIPTEISAKKIPLLGFTSRHFHYYTTVTPSDRPGDVQTIAGDVVVKPMINVFWLFVILALLVLSAGIIFQPYIHMFDCQDGRHNHVIVAGSSTLLNWDVSRFASKVVLNDGATDTEVSQKGTQYVSPSASTSYTIKSENFISKLLHIDYSKTIQVLVVPKRPVIDVFTTDKTHALFDEQVTINWSVEPNATSVSMTSNKSVSDLAPENYTGSLSQGYKTDTLVSLKAQNDSGYDMRSIFINVADDVVLLNNFTVWVRPNGIAVPENNDVRRNTRWGSLQLFAGSNGPEAGAGGTSGASGVPGVNPQPAAQSNTLEIPDNYNNVGFGSQNLNPEVLAVAGQQMPANTYSYQGPENPGPSAELLVSPSLNPTAVPTVVPTDTPPTVSTASDNTIIRQNPPATSPEGSSANRDFSIKLVEVIEDPLADSGYRVIEYFPDYVLQKGEQIMVSWNVDGVSKVKIENLSGDELNNVGAEYAYPDKSVTYTLTAQAGEVQKVYALPVNVAGDPDDGEGSGLKCELKANATKLKEPGSVMLTWTGGGTNRVQLLSSAKAEADNADAEKKKEEEAKEKGEKYEKKENQPLAGGIIADYLQPAGFIRVNVDKQTTFVLNAYDGSGNVICTKNVEVQFEDGNDKEDPNSNGHSFKIIRIADAKDVVQPFYTVGQTVQYTVEFKGFKKGKEPTGSVMITDGTGTCSVTLPVTTCSFVAKKAGDLTVTAAYGGDNVYGKSRATASERVIEKLPSSIQINSAIKPSAEKADVEVEVLWDGQHSYGLVPGGTVTLTMGSGTCDINMDEEPPASSCGGTVTKKVVKDDGTIVLKMTGLDLKDKNADRVTAAYKGDDYFKNSVSNSVLFRKINTQISIVNDENKHIYPYKPDENHATLEALFSWAVRTDDNGNPVWGRTAVNGYSPTGNISFILTDSKASDYGKCDYDLTAKKFSCEGEVKPVPPNDEDTSITGGTSVMYEIERMLLANPAADRVRAEYSGDSIFNASKSATVLFYKIPTKTTLSGARKSSENLVSLQATIIPDVKAPDDKDISGTLTFKSDAATCVLNISDDQSFQFKECSGTVDYKDGVIHISNMKMTGTPGDMIYAEYSGDSVYRSSTSSTVRLDVNDRTDTEITILRAAKLGQRITLIETELAAVKREGEDLPTKKPTGRIVYTSGSATCTLVIEVDPKDDTKRIISTEKCSVEKAEFYSDTGIRVTGMIMDGTPGENIFAEYKGDENYNSSISAAVPFTRNDTTTTIEQAIKDSDNKISLTLSLDPAEGPTGLITFRSGSATCVLNIDDRKVPEFTTCSGNVIFDDGKFYITDMVMKGTPGDTILAEYNGDDLYNKSTSPEVSFYSSDKTDTETVLNYAYLSGTQKIEFEASLSWDKAKAGKELPTGELTFIIGKDTCVLDVKSGDFDCVNSSTKITQTKSPDPDDPDKYIWKFESVPLENATPDKIKAVYSGDDHFNPSSSNTIEIVTVETELDITDAQKSPKGSVAMTMELSWYIDPPAGRKPGGTIILTSGSKSCTLEIPDDPDLSPDVKFKDCKAAKAYIKTPLDPKKWTFVIEKLEMGTKIGDSISAKYSGDGTFLDSSDEEKFKKLKTELEITDAYKPGESLANIIDMILSWDNDMSEGKAPTGTISLTFGSNGSTVCKLDIKTNDFDCIGEKTSIDPLVLPSDPAGNYAWTIKNIILKDKTADRVKAEYSGDEYFEPSSSKIVMLKDKKFNTTLTINKEKTEKVEQTFANIESLLSWKDDQTWIDMGCNDPSKECPTPTGTVKFTIRDGSQTPSAGDTVTGTCTLDLVKKTINCESKKVEVNPGSGDLKMTIERMLLADKTADRIKAEYSGDSFFNASESTIILFDSDDKVDTKLDLDNLIKSDTGHVDMKALLSWNKTEAAEKLPAGTFPTGTITFKIGSDSCKLTFDYEKEPTGHYVMKDFTCQEKGKTTVTPSGPADVGSDEVLTWTMTNILLSSGSNPDRVMAEYSGDANFNASSTDYILFDAKIDTVLKIESAVKNGNTVSLTAKLTPAGNETGTIIFTSGSGTCTLKIDDHAHPVFEKCSAKSVTYDSTGTIEIEEMHLSAAPGESIYAEYSGDAKYEKSTSSAYYFTKIDTELDITDAQKTGDGYVNLKTLLSWNKTEAGGKRPTGTITLKIGSDSCKLTFDYEKEPTGHYVMKDFTCLEKGKTTVTPSGPADVGSNEVLTWTMTNILLSSGSNPDRVMAEYSGDDSFNASSTDYILFDAKIDTVLKIESAVKNGNTVSLTAKLTPAGDETGTIVFTSGSGTCTLKIDDHAQPVFEKCSAKSVTYDSTGTIEIEEMHLSAAPGESIYAEYSGDAKYNKSTSPAYYFTKIDTELDITDAQKTGDGYVNLKTLLSWDKTEAGGKRPTGTITLKIGSDSCKLTFDYEKEPTGHYVMKDFTCQEKGKTTVTPSGPADVGSDEVLTWTMTDILLSSGRPDKVKAEYSGDDNFNASSSDIVLFPAIPTTLTTSDQEKTSDGLVNLTTELSWTEDAVSGAKPSGTIKFSMGAATCTLNLSETAPVFTDCPGSVEPPTPGTRKWTFTIEGLKIGDGTGDSITAVYSGDYTYLTSTSLPYYFTKIDTSLNVKDAYKPADGYANMTVLLSWDKTKADEKKPTGTITFTIGGDICKLTFDESSNEPGHVKDFTCFEKGKTNIQPTYTDDGSTISTEYTANDAVITWTMENILLSSGSTADRVKAEYSGNVNFNASSSDFVLFDTVPTTTKLSRQEKTPAGLINARVELSWNKEPMAGDDPKGTIRFTSGSSVCTLNLAVDPVRFTDCSGSVTLTPADKLLTFEISNLNMGSGVGEDIKAEYSGSGSFLASASDKKSFSKVDTNIVINNAYKPNDPNYANLDSVLSWNKERAAGRKPTGTIKFTVGGGTCELNLVTEKLSCESPTSDPITEGGDFTTSNYQVVLEKMLLADSSADRVTAEYSGDAVFNPSTSTAFIFKKLDTDIDIYTAYRDRGTGRASVFFNILWDDASDEGLKPTGTLKINLGSGTCTMNIKTRRLSCVADRTGTISDDGHDYWAENMLMTDKDAEIVSVEYSGDGFFNPFVSQEKTFGNLKTIVAVTAASKGCDGDNHCFINLSGTLDWEEEESMTTLPSGKLSIKLDKKTITFDLETETFTGVVEPGEAYKDIANQVVHYDKDDRHSFEFKNLLLDGVADETEIIVEYNGYGDYVASRSKMDMEKKTLGTINLITDKSFNNEGNSKWIFTGILNPSNYELPFDFNPTGKFTVGADYDDWYPSFSKEIPFDNAFHVLANNLQGKFSWKNKNIGQYELIVEFSGSASEPDYNLHSLTIKYNGDVSPSQDPTKASQLYNASNPSEYKSSATHDMVLNLRKLYLSKPGNTWIGFDFSPTDANLNGIYHLITESGTCILKYDHEKSNKFNDPESTCWNFNDPDKSIFQRDDYAGIINLKIGSVSDSSLTICFEGNDYYRPKCTTRNYGTKDKTKLEFISADIISNNLEVDLNLNLPDGHSYVDGDPGYYFEIDPPAGEVVIQAGNNYTCTIDLELVYGHGWYYHGTPRPDCGSDSIEVKDDPFRHDATDFPIIIKNIPIPDPAVDSVNVTYKGNTLYKGSGPVDHAFSRTKTVLTVAHTVSSPNEIETTIKPDIFSSGNRQLTGTVTYTFDPGGTTCTLNIGSNKNVTVQSCAGGSVQGVDYDGNTGTLKYTLVKNISETDEYVHAVYNGDGKYKGSDGSTPLRRFDLTLIPETTGLDASGRLYFNFQNVSVYYPKFPERDSYSYCQLNPSDTTNCRELEYKFTLTVRIETDAAAPAIPSGSKLRFLGNISSESGLNQCTINPAGNGEYTCILDNVYFTSLGKQEISVVYDESEYYNRATAKFPEMYAVSVSNTLTQTTTFIIGPQELIPGKTYQVKADTVNSADPGSSKPSDPKHMYYTYNRANNERLQSCVEQEYGDGCQLTITSDTTEVIAEYFGNGTYAASTGSKLAANSSAAALGSPVTMTISIGGEQGE